MDNTNTNTNTNINISYLRTGVYFDEISPEKIDINLTKVKKISNNYKKKYMLYSNSLHELINDAKYKKVIG